MVRNKKLSVQGVSIALYEEKDRDFFSLTDIARHKDSEHIDTIIQNWMRNRNTIELLGFWETIYNPNFKPLEFEGFRKQAGLNSFVMTPKKWIEATNAIGIVSKPGRYGGTFSKINYKIHTDAIKENLIPREITKQQASVIYANEADLLNVALFGMTSKEWRDLNSERKGNIRDYANLEQLVVLSNIESINALLIQQNLSQKERLQLNKVAITQMKSLLKNNEVKRLK